jgi:hypothetical protein
MNQLLPFCCYRFEAAEGKIQKAADIDETEWCFPKWLHL